MADTTLRADWYKEVVASDVNSTKPGIYCWVIEGAEGAVPGVYVGRYTSISRPRNEYRRNVQRILQGVPSHHPHGGFRRVHYALAQAVQEGRRITLTILANAAPADLNRAEAEYRRSEGANLNGRKQTIVILPPDV